MSNIKITQLPALEPTPLAGTDVFPVVSGNVTYQVTANAIAAFAGGGANTGNVTFNDITIQGTGDEYGGSGLYLAPGANSTGNLQYLRVRGGDFPTHIHLDTGNNVYFDQYFGADDKFVKLEANGNVLINANDLVGNSATWSMNINGGLALATVNNESTQLVGTRKIIGGATTGATAAYAVTLEPGGTPTTVYLSTPGVQSAKVTFVTQSNGSAFQWEQFDVVAVPSGDVPGAVNYVVSNRIKSTTTVPDTTVTATMNGAQIEITLTLSAAQTSGGWASFDATEFGLMVD